MQAMALTTPPIAPKKPHSFSHHGITISDDYAWLRDPDYPDVTPRDAEALREWKAAH